jgi:hypothetical protein
MNKYFENFFMVLFIVSSFIQPSNAAKAGAPSQTALAASGKMQTFSAGGQTLGVQAGGVLVADNGYALHIRFQGANLVEPRSSKPAAKTGKPTKLESVIWQNLWDGISLEYRAARNGIAESFYNLTAGGDVNQIRLQYNLPVKLREDGSLEIGENGGLRESAPQAWQEIHGQRVPVEVAYRQSPDPAGGKDLIGFRLGNYNPDYPVSIDPVLTNGEMWGGYGEDRANGVWVDASKNTYISGFSEGSWGSPVRAFAGAQDCQVSKFDVNGNLVWNTFLGGSAVDECDAIGYSTFDNKLYVAGNSYATWGSPANSFNNKSDLFIAVLDASSGDLLWNTFVGGAGYDNSYSLTFDFYGYLYVAGYSSATWGTPILPFAGNYAGYILKFNTVSKTIEWNTFLGGSGAGYTVIASISFTADGNLVVSGDSNNSWGTPIVPHGAGLYNAFIAKVNMSGVLLWNTFLGGAASVQNAVVGTDASTNIYVVGSSYASWGSPLHAFTGTEDVYIAKLNSNGVYQWHTFQGGTGVTRSYGRNVAVTAAGDVYVTGWTNTTWGTPVRAFTGGSAEFSEYGFDSYVVKVNNAGAPVWNTFLGGLGDESGVSTALDASGNVLVSGYGMATWGIPVDPYKGGDDIFLARLSSAGSLAWNTFEGNDGADGGASIVVDASNNIYLAGYSDGTVENISPVRAYTSGRDCMVTKIGPDGYLVWYTYLGGSGYDVCSSISLDAGGHLYVAGASSATWGSPFDLYSNSYDAFLTRLNATTGVMDTINGSIDWLDFIGGSGDDMSFSLVQDASGIFLYGLSSAAWGSPVDGYAGGTDAFIAKFNSGALMQWFSFLGGTGSDEPGGLASDGAGSLYVSGDSTVTWGAPKHAFAGSADVFTAKVNSNSGTVLWNTFLGGSAGDFTGGIALDAGPANAYVTGISNASWGSPKRAYTSSNDAFLAKVNLTTGLVTWNTFLGGPGYDSGSNVAVTPNGYVLVEGISYASWGNPVRSYAAKSDVFVASVNPQGDLYWNTFLGDIGADTPGGLYVSGNSLYLTGSSSYPWFYYDWLYNNVDAFWAQLDTRGQVYLPAILR